LSWKFQLGRKHSLLIGTLVLVFATLIYGSVPKYWVFLLAEFIFALGGSLISGANEALLYDSLKEEGKEEQSKKIFGKANSLHLAGILVGAPIGSLIAAKFGLNFPMQFSALSFALATLVAATIKEPKRSDKEESESKRYLNIVKQGLSFFVKHHVLRSLAVNSILVSVAAYFIIWLYQPLLEKAGVSVKYFGFIHSLLVIAQILVSANFEKLERWFGSSNAYTRYSAVLTAIPFLVVAILPGKVTVLMFVLLAGGFGLSRETFISSQMNKLIPSRQRATVLSSISMFRKFALAAFNPLAGFVADKSISWALFGLGLLPLSIFVIELVKTKAKLDKINDPL
jgi:MFS family permease